MGSGFVYFCPRCGMRESTRTAADARAGMTKHNHQVHNGAQIAGWERADDTRK